MIFERPEVLYAFFSLPVIAIFLYVQFRRSFAWTKAMSLEKPELIKARALYNNFFLLLTFAALIIAASSPSVLETRFEEQPPGKDIVFAFDISRSMDVRDISLGGGAVSRLEAARDIATSALNSLQNNTANRYAAVIGKGEGMLAIPLTYGAESVQTLFNALSSSIISAGGTNLEKLLDTAQKAFGGGIALSYPADKTIILFTDGEAHSGALDEAARKLQNENITLAAICIGSEEGGAVPVEGGFLTDKTGKIVISRAESAHLKSAAEYTGGFFINAQNIKNASTEIIEIIKKDSAATGQVIMKETHQKKDITFLFAACALILFAVHKYISFIRFQRKAQKKQTASALLVTTYLTFSLIIFISGCSQIETKLRLLEGNFYAAQGLLEEAAGAYEKAVLKSDSADAPYTQAALAFIKIQDNKLDEALQYIDRSHALITQNSENSIDGDLINEAALHKEATLHNDDAKELAYRLHYNSGIVYYYIGDAESAHKEFLAALLIDGKRIEAKRNLELSLALLANKNAAEAQRTKAVRNISEGEKRGASVLFDFIKQKETDRWKSLEWQSADSDSSLDY